MQQILKLIDLMNKFVMVVLGIMLGIMSVVIILQVSSRFIFNIPLPWSEELARYLMVYATFLGAAIALRYQRLISLEFVSERLSFQKRRILKTVVLAISIVFFLLLFAKGMEMVGNVRTQVSAAMQLPMSIPYASVPLGAVLLILNSIAVLIEMWTQDESAERGNH